MDDHDMMGVMLDQLQLLPKSSVALVADEILEDCWYLRVESDDKLYDDIAEEMVNLYLRGCQCCVCSNSDVCEKRSAYQWAFWFINNILNEEVA